MKKKLTYFIIFITINTCIFSVQHQDYTLFTRGKNEYYSENYQKAKQEFEILLRTFPNSNIFEKNYAYFYIGMTYYNLKEYKKAVLYLEKATYTPEDNELNDNSSVEKMIYFSQKDYALGDSLIKLNDLEKAFLYLNRINYTIFFPVSAYFEEKSLELLSRYTPRANSKLKLKFHYDFSQIPNLSVKELTEIGEFFISKKNYEKAEKYYTLLIKKYNLQYKSKKIYENYLNLLILDKNYDQLIKDTENIKSINKEMETFYRALAFYKKREFSRAVYLFEEIKSGTYYEKAQYYLASIYYSLQNYDNTINILRESKSNNILVINMLASSYLALDQKNNFKQLAKEIVTKFPNSYLGVYYSLMLEIPNTNLAKINSFKDLSLLANNIIKNSVNLPSDFLKKANSLEMNQLIDIAKFRDEELLKLIFYKRKLLEKKDLSYNYSITAILEKGDFYSLALKNSQKNMKEFLSYKELMQYVYPRYFNEDVKNYAKKYDVPEELIYTVIYNISGFDPFFTSEDSKIGLMGITYDKEDLEKMSNLFDVSYNIELGTKKLKELLTFYEENKLKTLISYIYGEEYLKNIYFINNDINLSSINIPEERYFLENLLLTYIFYSKLYKY